MLRRPQVFSGAVILPQHQTQRACPALIEFAEPAVLMPFRFVLFVFLPQQLQRDVFMVVQFFVKTLWALYLYNRDSGIASTVPAGRENWRVSRRNRWMLSIGILDSLTRDQWIARLELVDDLPRVTQVSMSQ